MQEAFARPLQDIPTFSHSCTSMLISDAVLSYMSAEMSDGTMGLAE